MRALVLLIIILVEIVYLIVGGFIFWALESSREQEQKTAQRNFNLSALLNNISEENPNMSAEDLRNFTNRILTLERSGLLQSKESNDWDIHGSIFFAMTVVTTIGYGNVTPKTTGGRVFCCFYAIIGIPFTMVMLLGVGEVLKKLSAKAQCSGVCRSRPHVHRIIHTFTLGAVGVILFLLVPAAIFTRLEGWSFGTGVYYGVITTTTVGFGDYVAAWSCVGSACWVYRISVGIWIFIGLAWLAGVIGAIQDIFQSLLTKTVTAASKKKKKNSSEEKNAKGEESEARDPSAAESDVTVSVQLEPNSFERIEHEIKYESARL